MAQHRVIVVGAGPAGVRAAEAVAAAGLRPIVLDEGRRDGGQIYRRQPDGFRRGYDKLYGSEAERARALHTTFDGLKTVVDYRPETLVWNIADGAVWTASPKGWRTEPYDALILCTGATDRLMPVKGWHFAGTYSLGGAQVALKSQACGIGRRVVFAGSGPLLYLVASQYAAAGADVAAVLDTSPFSARLAGLPKLLSQPDILLQGVALTAALLRRGVKLVNGARLEEIVGDPEAGVRGIVAVDGRGRRLTIDCDAVAMGHHLRPETQLADLARCDFAFDAKTRQWLPVRDGDGRASVKGVYLAGDGARILGARSAEVSGRLAALAALSDLGIPAAPGAMEDLRTQVAGYARFAEGLAEAFPWPVDAAARIPDETLICRCEAITAGELRRIVGQGPAREVNRAKAFSRVGMGRCQGRYCGLAAAEVIAAASGVPVEQVGRLRGQAPVKPLPVGIGAEEPAEATP